MSLTAALKKGLSATAVDPGEDWDPFAESDNAPAAASSSKAQPSIPAKPRRPANSDATRLQAVPGGQAGTHEPADQTGPTRFAPNRISALARPISPNLAPRLGMLRLRAHLIRIAPTGSEPCPHR